MEIAAGRKKWRTSRSRMSYLKTLYRAKYDFSNLPEDLLSSIEIVLSSKEFNAKIQLLDETLLKAIRVSQKYDERIEKMFEILQNKNSHLVQDNNGFNTKFAIHEANELFVGQKQVKFTEIPKEYQIMEIVFNRSNFVFNQARNWLNKNDYDSKQLPTFTEKTIEYTYGNSPIEFSAILDNGVIAYLSKI
jgi:hypothetical protein